MSNAVEPLSFLAGSEVLGNSMNGWMLDQESGGDRLFRSSVRFEKPFRQVPLVQVGLAGFDISNRDSARLAVATSNVTSEGFDIVLSTWLHTRLWRADVNWIAVGV